MQIQVERTERQRLFEQHGFLQPVRVLSLQECEALRAELQAAPAPLDWSKGHAATSSAFFQLASHPAIIERVVELIGEDVMLWGASLQRRKPGQVHPWHTDIETSADREGTVSVWIGLENTRAESSLALARGSHRLGLSLQEQAYQAGKHREEVTAEDVAAWTKARGTSVEIVQPAVTDGEALISDGRLWHGSANTGDDTRLAVLLQYARPDIPIWMPDLEQLEFPFRNLEDVRPPCVMVHGSTQSTVNRIVPAPSGSQGEQSRVKPIVLPLTEDTETGWAYYDLLQGPTRCVTDLNCHVSVLSAGASPHEPHLHEEEEILVVLDGRAELDLVKADGTRQRHAVQRGSCAYYPLGQAHTLHNTSAEPVTYVMFKWKGAGREWQPGSLQTQVAQSQTLLTAATPDSEGEGFSSAEAFQGTTGHLLRLHAHASVLQPGGGYEPHIDAYDVGMVLLEGTVETLDRRVEAPAVIFYAAGESHGIRNPGSQPASYLVFEFHGTAISKSSTSIARWVLQHTPAGALSLAPRPLKRLARRILLGY